MNDSTTAGRHPICAPIQHGDQTECLTCLKRWDTNDAAPPQCPEAGDDNETNADTPFFHRPAKIEHVVLFFSGYVLGLLSVTLPHLVR